MSSNPGDTKDSKQAETVPTGSGAGATGAAAAATCENAESECDDVDEADEEYESTLARKKRKSTAGAVRDPPPSAYHYCAMLMNDYPPLTAESIQKNSIAAGPTPPITPALQWYLEVGKALPGKLGTIYRVGETDGGFIYAGFPTAVEASYFAGHMKGKFGCRIATWSSSAPLFLK